MVALFNLVAILSAVAGSLASPVDPATRNLAERGPADFVLRNENAVQRRQSTNYDQDYTTGGDVVYTPNGNSFTVDWDTEDDFVVGVGWSTGNTSPITFSGSFGVGGGTGLLSVYGWTTSPLVEYYIIEDNSSPPSFGTEKGTVTSDGATYTIWENQRVDEPSIEGTSTFNQYILLIRALTTHNTSLRIWDIL